MLELQILCQCFLTFVFKEVNLLPNSMFIQLVDKELGVIEMAVYGDVIRPGNECRWRTVTEMLGKYKSKDSMAACKLPHRAESS